jgi:uncharacterized protein (DUF2235 family)
MNQFFQTKRSLKIYSDSRDTVLSLGSIYGRLLPVTTASINARTFRHTLSLDERRARFQAHFWKEKRIDCLNHYGAANHYTKTDVEEVFLYH